MGPLAMHVAIQDPIHNLFHTSLMLSEGNDTSSITSAKEQIQFHTATTSSPMFHALLCFASPHPHTEDGTTAALAYSSGIFSLYPSLTGEKKTETQ